MSALNVYRTIELTQKRLKPGPVMVDLLGPEITSVEKDLLQHPACGGVILFKRNIETPEQVRDLNRQIRAINPGLLLAVDQEGGRVQRLRNGFSELLPLRSCAQLANSEEQALQFVYHHARIMSLETLSVGFDISFAPVLDLCTKTSRVIGDRAFHELPDRIIPLAKAYIDGMRECGMAATGKHYPGHGSVDADSHVEIPVDERDFLTLQAHDLKPFVALASELGGIMPAHVIYPKVDNLPAGFSKIWINQILRGQIGFKGVVFSDDLSMKGAEVVGGFTDRADAALEAGCDMVLVCNNNVAAEQVLQHLESYSNPVASQRIFAMQVNSSNPVFQSGLTVMQASNKAWQESRAFLKQAI